jgi:deazaflavin-dependent oxidoreductase (nitroreductase family)
LPNESGPLVAGSNLGAPSDPAWVKNLRANSSARIVFAGRTSDIAARFLTGAERSAAFLEFKNRNDDYTTYEQMTDRIIPIIKLEISN